MKKGFNQFFGAGFTLIELLVVIAIIGVLSSVVLAALNNARGRAKDSAVKMAVAQFNNLREMIYDETGSYCGLSIHAWVTASGVNCDTIAFTGSLATQARAVCNNIYNNAGDIWGPAGAYRIYFGVSPDCNTGYSTMAALNDGKWYCSGSSGRKGEYTYYGDPPNSNPGCYANP